MIQALMVVNYSEVILLGISSAKISLQGGSEHLLLMMRKVETINPKSLKTNNKLSNKIIAKDL